MMNVMRARILLIEDEYGMGRLVQSYLEHDGYEVQWTRTGEEGLAEFGRRPADLVILDVGLPGMDGFDVCRRLRARSAVPIIVVSARADEADRVAGLELGADDYVGKPFSGRELLARVKALLRRAGGDVAVDAQLASEALTLGDIRLDTRGRDVTVGGKTVDLTAREFDLLEYVMRNRGAVFSREQLLERVWGLEYPGGTRTVDVHVAQLRRKLGRPDVIVTLRGVGYKAVDQ